MGNPVALEASAEDRETLGVHLDDDAATRVGVHRELHVGTSGLDTDPAQTGEGVVPHGLVLDVGQCLSGRYSDGVPGMHAHGVEVLDGTDDDAVVGARRA